MQFLNQNALRIANAVQHQSLNDNRFHRCLCLCLCLWLRCRINSKASKLKSFNPPYQLGLERFSTYCTLKVTLAILVQFSGKKGSLEAAVQRGCALMLWNQTPRDAFKLYHPSFSATRITFSPFSSDPGPIVSQPLQWCCWNSMHECMAALTNA